MYEVNRKQSQTQLYLVSIDSEWWVASGNYMFRSSWWLTSGCTEWHRKRELLKNPTKIEEIQEKKIIDRNW